VDLLHFLAAQRSHEKLWVAGAALAHRRPAPAAMGATGEAPANCLSRSISRDHGVLRPVFSRKMSQGNSRSGHLTPNILGEGSSVLRIIIDRNLKAQRTGVE
jgi:hypothetical protein